MKTIELSLEEKKAFEKAKVEQLQAVNVIGLNPKECRTIVSFRIKDRSWTFDLPTTIEDTENPAPEVLECIQFEIKELDAEGVWDL